MRQPVSSFLMMAILVVGSVFVLALCSTRSAWIFHLQPLVDTTTSDMDVAVSSESSKSSRYHAICSSSHDPVAESALGWEFAGPTSYVSAFGDDDDNDSDAPKLASAAAVQNVVQAANGTWFIGSVNGGIWKSTTFAESHVKWENVLDGQPVTCSSMSTLHVSSSNPNTIYAGCGGSTSGEQGYDWNVVNSGDWGGIMVSYDLGQSWRMIEGFPENYYVTDILEVQMRQEDTTRYTDSYHVETVLLVAAQSHLWNRDDGGIWRSADGGTTFDRVSRHPTFTLTRLQANSLLTSYRSMETSIAPAILATHAHSIVHTASVSRDGGVAFGDVPLPWHHGAVPFYTCATQLVSGDIVLGGLTRLAGGLPNNTDSQLFILSYNSVEGRKGSTLDIDLLELKQPMRMDQDSMPKDRMALLGDPHHNDLFYVAGNAEALAWRVNSTTGAWTKMWDHPDVMDGSIPHGDCRNYAWDENGGESRLILVSDGGVFARLRPHEVGGRWISMNGNYAGLELVSAKYDPRDDRYVAGAQDNCAIVTRPGASPLDAGLGFVEGDGTLTMVDSQANPSRMFGTTQFLGVGTIDDDPKVDSNQLSGDDEDEENCGGFCFVQGERYVQIPLETYFSSPACFPFFVHPYTLNRQDPTLLHIWANCTSEKLNDNASDGNGGAFYEFLIPYSVKESDDIAPPTKVIDTPPGAMILDFVSGGMIDGKPDPDLILGVSNTHLYVRSANSKFSGRGDNQDKSLVARPLPVSFAMPVTLDYDWSSSSPPSSTTPGSRILGPLTHHRTVFMSVASSNAEVIAITGWQDINSNMGEESIFATSDGGMTWQNVTGNLREASGVCGKVRPSGLLVMDLHDLGSELEVDNGDDGSRNYNDNDRSRGGDLPQTPKRVLLVGTSNGIFLTELNEEKGQAQSTIPIWRRLGTCEEFPIVLVSDIDYEPASDRLVAATYGRGIYVLKNFRQQLMEMLVEHGE